ncbi:hypothetical protein H1R16_09780 [Marnyiella aurantia]|uniref:Uncharacterized protein n=1 Tax=Marnyiella aurantia TaxID=2758037 RepID=A0A7D7LT03_9FLAO|nr:hypothetical protein [Marnyiella aurantia]MBA5246652.1 hypothetical protein [Marnyiella aurantia]QMS97993.1 hypothetical protein H1R16_09780 [Marnyiella aurantia]
MKSIYTLLFSLLISCLQGQEEKKAKVFENPSNARPFRYNDKLCFDYKVNYKGVFGGREVAGCFYINGETGAVLSFGFDSTKQAGCSYDMNHLDFYAYIQTLKGNTYTYYNSAQREQGTRNTILKHYVRTGNTDDSAPENMFTMKKFTYKNEFREFAGNEFKGRKYVSLDGEISVFILTDSNFPEAFEGLKFLGAYGIGFLETSKGNFLVLGYEQGESRSETLSFKKVDGSDCFHPSAFRREEDTRVVEALAHAEEDGAKVEEKLVKMSDSKDPCAALKMKVLAEQKKQNEGKKEQLNYLKDTRIDYSKHSDMEKAFSKYDHFESFKLMRLQDEYKICQIEEGLARNKYKGEELSRASKRRSCLQNKVEEFKAIELEVDATKARNRNNTTRLNEELRPIFMKIPEAMKKNPCS